MASFMVARDKIPELVAAVLGGGGGGGVQVSKLSIHHCI